MKRVKSLAVGFVVTVSLTTNVFAGFLTNVQKSVSEQEADKESEIAVTICDENFPTEKRAVFLVYETVADIGRQLGYVVQNNNPELSFNDNLQSIGMCHLYLTYYEKLHQHHLLLYLISKDYYQTKYIKNQNPIHIT